MNFKEKSKTCLESYSRLKNLKLVEKETFIPWQTVYWHLKKAGIQVTGDKALYGSSKDKFAHIGEQFFSRVIPYAENQNLISFQPKIDFIVKGYGVEIKSAKFTSTGNNKRWAFSLKKQNKVADFFILMAFNDAGNEILHYFLIPNELLRKEMQTISVSQNINHTKWKDFLISEKELQEFFEMIESK
jgi:hypothetical protein